VPSTSRDLLTDKNGQLSYTSVKTLGHARAIIFHVKDKAGI
jgi:hypothetical protein